LDWEAIFADSCAEFVEREKTWISRTPLSFEIAEGAWGENGEDEGDPCITLRDMIMMLNHSGSVSV